MGTDISTSVVSGTDLHVFGTKNLMVVDNSIFPFPMTGGTSWQAYVAGIKAADILVGVQQ
jgi:choline dehydrogenase-like flavoprotein